MSLALGYVRNGTFFHTHRTRENVCFKVKINRVGTTLKWEHFYFLRVHNTGITPYSGAQVPLKILIWRTNAERRTTKQEGRQTKDERRKKKEETRKKKEARPKHPNLKRKAEPD